MARGLGIEIDSDAVRVLALDGGKRPRIAAFAERAIEADEARPWADRARDAVKAALAEAGGPRGRIAASIDSGDAILRELQLPFTNDEQIRKTVRYELEQHVHNHSIEDLVVDYVKTGSTEKGTQILVAAVPKKLVEERLQLLDAAGADPAVLDLDALALFNALLESGAVTDDAPVLALYGGSRFTKFVLIENRRPRAIRTIRYSSEPAPAQPEFEALAAPADSGEPEPIVVVDNPTPVDILAIEAGRFLMASAASVAPARVLILGRLDVAEVAGPLSEATGAPVESVDLLARFGAMPAPLEGIDRRVPVALGLALKAIDRDAAGTDFRRDEYSFARKFETIKSSALVMVYLVLMLLGLVGLHLHFKAADLDGQRELVERYQAEVVADAVEHNPSKIPADLRGDLSQSRAFMTRRLAELAKEVGAGDHPIERSSLNLLSRIWKRLDQFHREQGTQKLEGKPFYFLVDAANAQQDAAKGTVQVTLSGLAASVSLAEAYRMKLQAEPLFAKGWVVEAGQYRPEKDYMRYSLTIRKAGP